MKSGSAQGYPNLTSRYLAANLFRSEGRRRRGRFQRCLVPPAECSSKFGNKFCAAGRFEFESRRTIAVVRDRSNRCRDLGRGTARGWSGQEMCRGSTVDGGAEMCRLCPAGRVSSATWTELEVSNGSTVGHRGDLSHGSSTKRVLLGLKMSVGGRQLEERRDWSQDRRLRGHSGAARCRSTAFGWTGGQGVADEGHGPGHPLEPLISDHQPSKSPLNSGPRLALRWTNVGAFRQRWCGLWR